MGSKREKKNLHTTTKMGIKNHRFGGETGHWTKRGIRHFCLKYLVVSRENMLLRQNLCQVRLVVFSPPLSENPEIQFPPSSVPFLRGKKAVMWLLFTRKRRLRAAVKNPSVSRKIPQEKEVGKSGKNLTILSSLMRSTEDSSTWRTQQYLRTRSGLRISTDMWIGLGKRKENIVP